MDGWCFWGLHFIGWDGVGLDEIQGKGEVRPFREFNSIQIRRLSIMTMVSSRGLRESLPSECKSCCTTT
jgi:hypothetical protein